MSDPRYTDPVGNPRPVDPVMGEPVVRQTIHQEGRSSSMWGWVAGLAVLALIAFVMIAGYNNSQDTASNNTSPPAASAPVTTGSGATTPSPAPQSTPAPSPQAPPANQ